MPTLGSQTHLSTNAAIQDAFNRTLDDVAINYADIIAAMSSVQQAYTDTVYNAGYTAPVYNQGPVFPTPVIGVPTPDPSQAAYYAAQSQEFFRRQQGYTQPFQSDPYASTQTRPNIDVSLELNLDSIFNELILASNRQMSAVIDTSNRAIEVIQDEFNRDFNGNDNSIAYLVERLTQSIDQLIREDRANLTAVLSEVSEFTRHDLQANQDTLDSFNRDLEIQVSDELENTFRQLTEFSRDLGDEFNRSIDQQQETIDRLLEELGQAQPQFPTDFSLKLKPETEDNLNKALDGFESFTSSSKNFIDEILAIFAPITGINIPGVGSIGEQISLSITKQLDIFKDIILKIKQGKYKSWNEFYTDYTSHTSLPELVTTAQNGIAIFELTLYFLRMFGRPLIEGLQQLQSEDSRLTLLNYDEAIRAYYREWFSQDQVNTELAKQGFSENRIQALWEITKPLLTSPDLLRAYYKGSADYEYILGEILKQGYTEEQLKLLLDASVNELDETTLNIAFNRGEITEERYRSTLRKLAYDERDIDLVDKLRFVIPPIQDLIQMAVKDAFDETIVADFGLKEQYPKVIEEWALKQGLVPYWFEKYWISHWRYPSVEMGYDMLHRRIISQDRLKLLMKALDIAPRWRDELIKLSYHPLTRVDVRRMYGVGVLNYNEVIEAYLDLGYDQTNAKRLADFTVRYEAENDTDDLSNVRRRIRSAVENSYLRGSVDRQRAITLLVNTGYSPEIADKSLGLIDLQRSIDSQQSAVDKDVSRAQTLVKNSYKRGTIPRQEAFFQLLQLKMPQGEIESDLDVIEIERSVEFKNRFAEAQIKLFAENIIEESEFNSQLIGAGFTTGEIGQLWAIAKIEDVKKFKKPTEARLKKWLDKGIITLDQYRYELAGLGYNAKYIDWITIEELQELEV